MYKRIKCILKKERQVKTIVTNVDIGLKYFKRINKEMNHSD